MSVWKTAKLRDVARIEGLGIIGIIVLGMPLQPCNRARIVGMTGVVEDVHQPLIPWHTATVLGGTGACSRQTARVLDAFVLQQDALQHHLVLPPISEIVEVQRGLSGFCKVGAERDVPSRQDLVVAVRDWVS